MGKKEELVKQWVTDGTVDDDRIMQAFMDVKREDFIKKDDIDEAYGDYPLQIGFGQSISQPTTVVLMIKYLDLKPEHNVLEIGTGSGYNTALLSRLCRIVYSVENNRDLCESARNNLYNAMVGNAEVICRDGSSGYKESGLYDRIIITAAVPKVPEMILKQLKVGGVLVAPVGDTSFQEMTRIEKTESGYKIKEYGTFRFVPLTGKYGFNDFRESGKV